MKRLTGLLLALLLPAGRAGAQPEARPPRTTASVELSLFNLDVVVTDADGRPVHGLRAEDFEVTHGGRRVTITNFGEVRAEEPPPPGPRGGSSSSSTGSRSRSRTGGPSSSGRSAASSARPSGQATRRWS